MSKDLRQNIKLKKLQEKTDFSDGRSIERYAMYLEGMTFGDVLDLDIHPKGGNEPNFSNPNYKGGMGTLLEERYFGYKANSDEGPDFAEAGVELKSTCYDSKWNREYSDRMSAGEDLPITTIHFNEPVCLDFYSSKLWKKCQKILLVYYQREKKSSNTKLNQRIELNQRIKFVYMLDLTKPEFADDLEIIRNDYENIIEKIQTGYADGLSARDTRLLCAKTKDSAPYKKVPQFYARIDEHGNEVQAPPAKKRSFYFKRKYMDYLLHERIKEKPTTTERIFKGACLVDRTLEKQVEDRIKPYIGRTDIDLCDELAVKYSLDSNSNNSVWTTLAYRMLQIKNRRADEFLKAGISVRAVRIEEGGDINESLSFAPFEFLDLVKENWEDSDLRTYLEETEFFFVVFAKEPNKNFYQLLGCCFWNMPADDIEGPAKACWEQTKNTVINGVKLEQQFKKDGTPRLSKKGKPTYSNNLPKESENSCMHVRPHAGDSFYDFGNGKIVGDSRSNASELPDGRWMTKQSFWLNSDYVLKAIKNELGEI